MAEQSDSAGLDEELSQSRLGCAVLVGLALLVVAVAAAVPVVRSVCCDEDNDDGVATVRFEGRTAGSDWDPDDHGRAIDGASLVVIDAVNVEEWWSILGIGESERNDYLEASPITLKAPVVAVDKATPVVTVIAVTDGNGEAEIDLPFGSYLICMAAHISLSQYRISVCDEFDICDDTNIDLGAGAGFDTIGERHPEAYGVNDTDTEKTVTVRFEAGHVSDDTMGPFTDVLPGQLFYVVSDEKSEMWWAALGLQERSKRSRLIKESRTAVYSTIDRDSIQSLTDGSHVTDSEGTIKTDIPRGDYLICAAHASDDTKVTVCDDFSLRCDTTVRYSTNTNSERLMRHHRSDT